MKKDGKKKSWNFFQKILTLSGIEKLWKIENEFPFITGPFCPKISEEQFRELEKTME